MRSLGGFLLLLIMWNRICIAIRENNGMYFLLDSWCWVCNFLMALALMFRKKGNKCFHFTGYMELVGGTLTLNYPNFLSQSESFIYPITMKKWYYLPLGMTICMSLGIFMITALSFNDTMKIINPLLPNTIFTWWLLGILIMIMSLIIEGTYDYFLK